MVLSLSAALTFENAPLRVERHRLRESLPPRVEKIERVFYKKERV